MMLQRALLLQREAEALQRALWWYWRECPSFKQPLLTAH